MRLSPCAASSAPDRFWMDRTFPASNGRFCWSRQAHHHPASGRGANFEMLVISRSSVELRIIRRLVPRRAHTQVRRAGNMSCQTRQRTHQCVHPRASPVPKSKLYAVRVAAAGHLPGDDGFGLKLDLHLPRRYPRLCASNRSSRLAPQIPESGHRKTNGEFNGKAIDEAVRQSSCSTTRSTEYAQSWQLDL